jgi:hypothetical protein
MEALAVPDKVTISHRGARYEIGRGKRYYGVWVAGAPQSDPIDRWPETPEGWAQAWTRFSAMETPGTITPVSQPGFSLSALGLSRLGRGRSGDAGASGPGRRAKAGLRVIAAGLLALGVIVSIAGLFPDYFTGQSLASSSDQLIAHLFYLAGWAVSAVLIVLGGRKTRLGALIGTGLSAVTLGLFVTDLGQGAGTGTGMILSIIGWVACAAGAGLALAARPLAAPATDTVPAGGTSPEADTVLPGDSALPGDTVTGDTLSFGAGTATDTISLGSPAAPADPQPAGVSGNWVTPAASTPDDRATAPLGGPVRPRTEHVGPLVLLVIAAIGTIVSFAAPWDSYTLQSAAGTQTTTLGNAFTGSGLEITGNVLVMVAVIAMAVLAALWRPARQGAALLTGAIVAMLAQAISALIQAAQPVNPEMFGISPAQASAAGLSVTSGVTPIFWVYCVFIIALIVSAAWLLTEPARPAPAAPVVPSPWTGSIPPLTPMSPHQGTDGNSGTGTDSETADTDESHGDGRPEGNTESSYA